MTDADRTDAGDDADREAAAEDAGRAHAADDADRTDTEEVDRTDPAGDTASTAGTRGRRGTPDDGDPVTLLRRPRIRSAVAWGAVSALSFLVLHQAYLIAGGRFVGVGTVATVTVAVGAFGASLSYAAEGRLRAR